VEDALRVRLRQEWARQVGDKTRLSEKVVHSTRCAGRTPAAGRQVPHPDGKGQFSPLELPEERVPVGQFHLATRRGRQFNSIMLSDKDPLTGARRNDILMSPQDAARLALRNGDPITLRNELGEFHGHVRIDPIKPGCLEAHWPEVNFLIRAGRLDTSGISDYSATVPGRQIGRFG